MNRKVFAGGVIFDFDDTIVATRKTRAKLLQKIALSHFGTKITNAQIDLNWGKPFNKLIENLLPGVELNKFSNIYSNEMQKVTPKALDGVLTLFNQASVENFAIFILSSSSNKLIYQDLKAINLSEYIFRLWGHEDTYNHKPNPSVLDPVISFSNNVGIQKDSLLYIGDSIWDYHIAKARELCFIAVLTGNYLKRDFESSGLNKANIVQKMTEIRIKNQNVLVRNKAVLSLKGK